MTDTPPTEITGPCPECGTVATRDVYDIGSGPELSCANCEQCWGVDGQVLRPLPRPGTPPGREYIGTLHFTNDGSGWSFTGLTEENPDE